MLGLELGLYIWALVAASEVAYTVLRVAGAAFLVWLGVRSWRAAWRSRRDPDHDADGGVAVGIRRTRWGAFAEGAVVQLANPKAAVFMMAFYPQFVPADRPLLATTAMLAMLQVAIEICFYLTLAACVGRAGTFFRRAKVRRRVEAVSGTVLVGLGARVATVN